MLPTEASCADANTLDDYFSEEDRMQQFLLSRAAEFNRMRDTSLTDMVIVVENEEFPVHSEILCAASEFFKCKIQYETLSDTRLVITGVSAESFKRLLNFIYTGKCIVSEDTVSSLFQSGDYFNVPDLLNVCEKWLLERLQFGSELDKTILLSAIDLVNMFGVPTLFAHAYSELASNVDKYKDIIVGIGVDTFYDHLKTGNVPIFDNGYMCMGQFYFEAVSEIYKKFATLSNSPDLTIITLEDCRTYSAARPSCLYISEQRCGQYPTDHSSYGDYTDDWFVTCKDFPPDQWAISGMTIYEMRRWGCQDGVLTGADVEYRNIWTGERRSFLCGLNTEHGMEYKSVATFSLEPGETISCVDAFSGWLFNNMAFDTSTQRRLGYFRDGLGGGQRDINRSSNTYSFLCTDDKNEVRTGSNRTAKSHPCLALHGIAYELIETFEDVTWANVQFIFSGLKEEETPSDMSKLFLKI